MDWFYNLRNQHGLVLSVSDHVGVSVISDREEMRWHLCSPLTLVLTHHVRCVNRQATVRVNGHTKQP